MRGPCEGCGKDAGFVLRRWVVDVDGVDLMLCPGCFRDAATGELTVSLRCARCQTTRGVISRVLHVGGEDILQELCSICRSLADQENLTAAARES